MTATLVLGGIAAAFALMAAGFAIRSAMLCAELERRYAERARYWRE